MIKMGARSNLSAAFLGGMLHGKKFQGAMNMKCPMCGGAELVHDTRDMPYTYKGESTIIPAVTGDYCPVCDEAILDINESRRTSASMREFSNRLYVRSGCIE